MDPRSIKSLLEAAAEAPHSQGKGKAYEDLVTYLFESVPGCIVDRDITNVFGTEQIDLAVGNIHEVGGLRLLPPVFLVECKNWDEPVDSQAVGYFFNILASRSLELGVLIAANGVTGDLTKGHHAHALGLGAAPRGIKMIVITTKDLSRVEKLSDFIELFHRRYLRACATGQLGAPGPDE
ncbi:NERD domain-containing protein [Micromonospora sp. C51]|uniref:nuclease-related domain-containing protein n=1 Tax=Micromonospora sp. C51 TaxID=2824879 RepID=UPI001B3595F8|nr:nuclease-related domain-containing protein [Micromonospora sp. C51]MBQ1052155.1 NERD domain-containing protein [Micromonospora sp. C51]